MRPPCPPCLRGEQPFPNRTPPILGLGPSRLAARACAECRLPPQRLAEADARWLWPEDEAVAARLRRLGLETFGAVAALAENALVYQFGRVGRLLHHRAHGQDFTPVRALYPPPVAEAGRDCSFYPLTTRQQLQRVTAGLGATVAHQLGQYGRVGRRVTLQIATERGELRRERVLTTSVQTRKEVVGVALHMLEQIAIPAAVTGLRLRIDELEFPAPRTPDMFQAGDHRRHATLATVQQALTERYGPRILLSLAQQPASPREQRHALWHDHWEEER